MASTEVTKKAIPLGFAFRPDEGQIVGIYLRHLVKHGAVPDAVQEWIHGVDINGPTPPWEIAALLPEHQREDFYVFSKLKKLSKGRNKRTADDGQGTWKGETVGKPVVGFGVVGEKRVLSFKAYDGPVAPGKKRTKVTSHWTMHEYNALQIDGRPVVDDAGDCRWVICHVTYSKRKKTNSHSDSDQENKTDAKKIKKDEMPRQFLGIGPNFAAPEAPEAPRLTQVAQLAWNIGDQGSLSSSSAPGIEDMEAYRQLLSNFGSVSQPQFGAGQYEVPSEFWNMLGANQDAMSPADIGGQHYGVASQSWNMFEANQNGGVQEYDDNDIYVDEIMALLEEEEEDLSHGTEEIQHLLDDPAAAVEAEKECLEQQGWK